MSLEMENAQFLTGLGVTLLAFLGVVGLFAAARPRAATEPEEDGYRLEERVLMGGFLAMPTVGILLGMFVTGVFNWRYALPCVTGLCLLLGHIARQATGARPAAAAALLALFGLTGLARAEFVYRLQARQAQEYQEARALLDRHCRPGERVVIGHPGLYIKMAHYGAGHARPAFAASVELPPKYGVTDSADRALLALQPLAGLDLIDFERFADHPGPTHLFVPLNWMKKELEGRGHRLRPVARCKVGVLYRLRRSRVPAWPEGGGRALARRGPG
jgi:hypothetical protein